MGYIHMYVYIHAGVISGALLYIRDDFKSVDRNTWLQVLFYLELIMSLCMSFLVNFKVFYIINV